LAISLGWNRKPGKLIQRRAPLIVGVIASGMPGMINITSMPSVSTANANDA